MMLPRLLKTPLAVAALILPALAVPAPSGMPSVGQPVANTPLDMKFTALDGTAVDIAKLKGKVVLIDFWAIWCIPCVAELPNVKKVYEQYKDQGFQAIGVSFDNKSEREKLIAFVKKKGLTWPQRFDGNMFDATQQKLYNIKGIPATYLIDKQGKLVEVNVKGKALEPAVRKHLGLS